MRETMQRIIEAIQRGRRFVTQDVWTIGLPGEEVPRGFIIKQIRVAILLVSNLMEGALMLRASALTFATILSIVPFLAVMFYVIQTFNLGGGIADQFQARLEATIDQAVEFLLEESPEEGEPSEDEVEAVEAALFPEEASGSGLLTTEVRSAESAPEEPSESREDKNKALQNRIMKAFFRDVGQQSDEDINPVQWVADIANDAATDARALSISGILLVFTTVFGLMRNIEKSFNDIWGVRRTRSWYRMFSDYLMITLLLPFVAAALLGITAALKSDTIAESLGPLAYFIHGIQYFVIGLVFAALYYVVPNTRVRGPYALLGGIVAGLLWVLLSWTYVNFQIGLARYNAIFSAFAQFPMLLMWVYLSWIILLFGAELSFAYQNEKTFAMERFADGASYAYREALGLRAMVEAGRRFTEGLPGLGREKAAEEWNVPQRLLGDSLAHLEAGGFLRACATEPVTYQPSRPLEKITVADIVSALREVGRDPSLFRDDATYKPFFDELGRSENAFVQASIAELVERLRISSAPTEIRPPAGTDA